MNQFSQGDIIRISNLKNRFLIISKNAFIRATGAFHVCLLMPDVPEGPLHIRVQGAESNETSVVLCEQIKLIDPSVRSCRKTDHLSYPSVMDISDAIQVIFEYD